jgi:enediyne biosynthesis protein E4
MISNMHQKRSSQAVARTRILLGVVVILGLGAISLGQTGPQPAVPKFIEETASSGLSSRFDGDWEFMVGGGVASFDCNADGLPELYLAGGTNESKFYRNSSAIGGALKLEQKKSGLEMTDVTGAYPLDVDSDGITDVMVLRVGENVLYRGLGDCQFERANEGWGFQGGDAWHVAFSATWERGLSWPTLAVGGYIDRTKEDFPWGSCTNNLLVRPNAAGTGFDAPAAMTPSYCSLSMLFTDWNRSGTPSLRVSNDREYYKGGQEQLWKIRPGMPPRLYTEAEGWKRLQVWGMGIASADVNFDGRPDYFLTSMADSKLQIRSNPTSPTFADEAFKRGVTAHRPYTGDATFPSTGWHAQFEDINNDGLSDLFISKGNIAKMPDFAMEDPNNLLLGRADGTFLEVGDKAGIASTKRGRGAQVVDLNADGLLDLVVVNRWDDAQVWRNVGAGDANAPKPIGNWLQVKLEQQGPNRDVIGAWLEVKLNNHTMRREQTVGGGHASGSIGWIHVGLGDASEARVRVRWPDGQMGAWETVRANQFVMLERGRAPRAWTPKN